MRKINTTNPDATPTTSQPSCDKCYRAFTDGEAVKVSTKAPFAACIQCWDQSPRKHECDPDDKKPLWVDARYRA